MSCRYGTTKDAAVVLALGPRTWQAPRGRGAAPSRRDRRFSAVPGIDGGGPRPPASAIEAGPCACRLRRRPGRPLWWQAGDRRGASCL